MDIVIIGAGPAGLAAALECVKLGVKPIVLEADQVVGGICRTVERDGFRFDIGGHRFFTKNEEVMSLWQETLGLDDFVKRPRLSRIYLDGKFYQYPVQPMDALKKMGIAKTARILADYAKARVSPLKPEATLDRWLINRFGQTLYETFFKAYTEKVWGRPCSEISAAWGAQRIKGLSLWSAVLNALTGGRSNRTKSMIEEFWYPRLGVGQMYDAMRDRLVEAGVEILYGHRVDYIGAFANHAVKVGCDSPEGRKEILADSIISSMPYTHLVNALPICDEASYAASSLRYRSLLTVNLMLEGLPLFLDTWLYIHDPSVRVGRIQNPSAWSPVMVPDGSTSVSMEYFVDEGDRTWGISNTSLIEMGLQDLWSLGFIDDYRGARIVDEGRQADPFVIRQAKCYPVHDGFASQHVATMREVTDRIKNLWPVGRYGMFKYNNMDHSILTGMLAARNAILGETNDLWEVNADDDYHETHETDKRL